MNPFDASEEAQLDVHQGTRAVRSYPNGCSKSDRRSHDLGRDVRPVAVEFEQLK